MFKLVMIGAGGAVGAVLRYGVTGVGQRIVGASFPLGTMIANLTGCLLIGLLAAVFAGPYLVREEYRAGLMIGVLGAFTTFSTFGWETFALANDGQRWAAALNVVATNIFGLLAVWVGYRVGQNCFGA